MDKDTKVLLVFSVLFFGGLAAFLIWSAKVEASNFNRHYCTNYTWIDAVASEFRIQGPPKDCNEKK